MSAYSVTRRNALESPERTAPGHAPVMREIVARAPTRIDLGGGWTDVSPYCDREGGFVCNVAITRYSVARLSAGGGPLGGDVPLVRAALRRAGAPDIRVALENEFPVGAGLGGSSAASAAVLGAIAAWRGTPLDRAAIAEEGRRIELEDLGVAGGRQDHYAATFGGALGLTFNGSTAVKPLALSASTRAELASRSILVYTGESRISGDTITAVLGAYEAGEARVVGALARMKALAREMADQLERGQLDAVGALVAEHWEHQRSLHPTIPTPRIDEIIARGRRAGALGAKAMGASGGGCVLLIAPANAVAAVRDAVAPLGDIVDFSVDAEGLAIVRDRA